MPRNASAYYFIGASFYNKGDYQNAKKSYQSAIDLLPNYADAFVYLGLCYVQLEKFDSAMYCVRSAENISPISAARQLVSLEYVRKGNSRFELGDGDEALKYYLLAGNVDPSNAEAMYDIGGIYLTRHDVAKAREYWKKTLSLNPNHKEAKEWIAKIGG